MSTLLRLLNTPSGLSSGKARMLVLDSIPRTTVSLKTKGFVLIVGIPGGTRLGGAVDSGYFNFHSSELMQFQS